jgi:glycine cleavage system H protein
MVDHGFEVKPGASIHPGQILGWVEGFKAISDLYGVVEGVFIAGNPALAENISLVSRDPHGAGWLYEAQGKPDARCLKVQAYRDLLNKTIDRLRQRQTASPPPA